MTVETSGEAIAERAGEPYLVYKGKSRTCRGTGRSAWDRQQRKIYGAAASWLAEKGDVAKMQVLWITLTSANNGRGAFMSSDIKELIKRIHREYGYEADHFIVETAEGHGVAHGFLAIKSEYAVYIHIAWLRSEWEKIHGAWNVSIRRLGSKHHKKNCNRYIVNQYCAGQSMIKRHYYDWRTCKLTLGRGWNSFRRLVIGQRPVLYMEKRWGREFPVREWVPMADIVAGWRDLLEFGWCICDGHVYQVEGRCIVERRVYESLELTELPDMATI